MESLLKAKRDVTANLLVIMIYCSPRQGFLNKVKEPSKIGQGWKSCPSLIS